jgi:hypothetical protein
VWRAVASVQRAVEVHVRALATPRDLESQVEALNMLHDVAIQIQLKGNKMFAICRAGYPKGQFVANTANRNLSLPTLQICGIMQASDFSDEHMNTDIYALQRMLLSEHHVGNRQKRFGSCYALAA